MARIEILKTDITELECDAIVNAANSSLMGGGGVDGAIHSKAGPELIKECQEIGGCPTGEARITNAYNLKAKYIIHAVGPRWKDGLNGEEELLRNAYIHSMKLASENRLHSIAFPNISTGIFAFPKVKAAQIALSAIQEHAKKFKIKKVVIACFDDTNYEIYRSLTMQEV